MQDPTRFDTPWRRMAAATFPPPHAPVALGSLDLDVTAAEAYREEVRRPGVRLALVHFVAAAAARTVAFEVPEANCYVRRGRVRPKEELDVVLPATLPGREDLVEVRVSEAHTKTVFEIADELQRQLAALRRLDTAGLLRSRYALARIPWPLRRLTFGVLRTLSVRLGVALPQLGMGPGSFGSFMLSDLGRYRPPGGSYYSSAHAPLFPAAQLSTSLVLCPLREAPVVRGDEVVIRTMALLCGTYDHRLLDGGHIVRLMVGIDRRLQHPDRLAETPDGSDRY